MQFIESSVFGVRAARLTFSSRHTNARVTLFPMVHVGGPEFYRATYADALSHDVVLWEGVRSPIAMRITRSYRWLLGSRAMAGVVLQPRVPIDPAKARLATLPDETGLRPPGEMLVKAVSFQTETPPPKCEARHQLPFGP